MLTHLANNKIYDTKKGVNSFKELCNMTLAFIYVRKRERNKRGNIFNMNYDLKIIKQNSNWKFFSFEEKLAQLAKFLSPNYYNLNIIHFLCFNFFLKKKHL
jgi:hypothetical protein